MKNITNKWVFFGGQNICFPDSKVVFDLVTKTTGISMNDLHNLGYRSVFDPLEELILDERIFRDNYRYYPNN